MNSNSFFCDNLASPFGVVKPIDKEAVTELVDPFGGNAAGATIEV
ncbi:MAG: hypothetical protein ACO3ZW_01630 [Opitutales bacterium]|jgi:hypothetical protein